MDILRAVELCRTVVVRGAPLLDETEPIDNAAARAAQQID